VSGVLTDPPSPAVRGIPSAPGTHPRDAAYHAKYDRYGPAIVGSVVGEKAAPGTLRLDPRA
jgi:hypothetical protein